MVASRKPGLRFCLYLLIRFLPALLGLDPNGAFVWCSGGRFTPYTIFYSGQMNLYIPILQISLDLYFFKHQAPYASHFGNSTPP